MKGTYVYSLYFLQRRKKMPVMLPGVPYRKYNFLKKSTLNFYHRKMDRNFLFQNIYIYSFSRKGTYLTDSSNETLILQPWFSRDFRAFFKCFQFNSERLCVILYSTRNLGRKYSVSEKRNWSE
jgi:hypothetical protein